MFRLSTLLCLATVCVLAVPHAALAASDENILLLGVARAGKFDQRLTKDLSDHLARSGETVSQRSSLSSQDRNCTDQECLDRLAEREKAQVVLTTQLQENGSDAYYVVMTLFDAVRHSPLTERNLCDQCTGDTLTLKLSDTADKLLKRYRDRKNRVATDPTGPGPDGPPHGTSLIGPDGRPILPPGKTTPTTGWSLSPKRKVIAGVLGGLAGAALITSIALTATNGQDTGLPCGMANQLCALDNKALFISGYVATGLLLGGVALTLFWPSEKSTDKKPADSQALAEVK